MGRFNIPHANIIPRGNGLTFTESCNFNMNLFICLVLINVVVILPLKP